VKKQTTAVQPFKMIDQSLIWVKYHN